MDQKEKGRQVLLVEDVELNQQLAKTLLEAKGLLVDLAINGKEAIEKVENKHYDLVLMDIHMPLMDGVEATKRIRALADPRKSTIPIVALTANSSPVEDSYYRHYGMNDVIPKPIEDGKFTAILKRYTALGNEEKAGKNDECRGSQLQDSIKQTDPELKNIDPGTPTSTPGPGSATPVPAEDTGQRSTLPGPGSATPGPVEDPGQRSTLPGPFLYDLSFIRSISGGDATFVQQMVELFISTMPSNIEALDQAIQAKDWDATWKAAHKMKSTIDSMQIVSLKQVIRDIEMAGRKVEDVEKIPALRDQVAKVISECISQLKAGKSL